MPRRSPHSSHIRRGRLTSPILGTTKAFCTFSVSNPQPVKKSAPQCTYGEREESNQKVEGKVGTWKCGAAIDHCARAGHDSRITRK
ncbi:hypothetical protein ACLOJK_015871 [Asimina triloba]